MTRPISAAEVKLVSVEAGMSADGNNKHGIIVGIQDESEQFVDLVFSFDDAGELMVNIMEMLVPVRPEFQEILERYFKDDYS